MFLFIAQPNPFAKVFPAFKYISCSYLSSSGPSLTYPFVDLNTSHVLIYQWIQTAAYPITLFKYISCSYLSTSSIKTRIWLIENLNTSHVLIYQEVAKLAE